MGLSFGDTSRQTWLSRECEPRYRRSLSKPGRAHPTGRRIGRPGRAQRPEAPWLQSLVTN
jgi:hypothetical protein